MFKDSYEQTISQGNQMFRLITKDILKQSIEPIVIHPAKNYTSGNSSLYFHDRNSQKLLSQR